MSSPIGVALVATDGTWSWVNEALCTILGRSADELLTLTFQDVTHPDDVTADEHLVAEVLEGRRSSYQMVKRYLRPDGTEVPVLLSVILIRDDDGRAEHFVSQVVDLTDERRAAERSAFDARIARMQLDSAVSALGLGAFSLDERTGRYEVNDTFAEMYGIDRSRPVTFDTIAACIHPDDREAAGQQRAVGNASGVSYENRYRIVRPDGSVHHVRVFAVRSAFVADAPAQVTGVVIDETEHLTLLEAERSARVDAEAAREALAHQALHDPLTGLPNRHLLLDRLSHALARRSSVERQVALLFVDLDRFKVVNDSLGHAAGDQLLVEAARRLRAAVRPEDLVARLGGDEFVILIEDTPDGDEIAERVVRALAAPFSIDGHVVPSSASVGIALAHPGADAGTLLRDADAAMYVAKDRGRARAARFDPLVHTAAVDRLELGSELPGAAGRGELVLHYQPAFRPDGRIDGIEALLRWQHPTRGLIAPAGFLPLAEESGAIIDIGRWVRRAAAQQVADWRAGGLAPPRVWCNVSAVELGHGGVAGDLTEVCAALALTPDDIGIEVTESVLLDAAASAALDQVSAAGFRVAIDDFGTGYSSLAYLVVHHVDVLKIDRRFVARAHEDRAAAVIVRTVVDLARNLDARSVAEGVENDRQHAAVADAGCDAISGFLLARPAPHEVITPMLHERRAPSTPDEPR